ncbi:MAG: signal peptidase I [Chloroflexi bacterium]|nr:signal peptidase I [Chloroflexota bacterium]MBU1751733.1 signal peptidase I [Chloroflexota bacterium]
MLREVLETIVIALFIFFVMQLVIQNYEVLGYSMEPTLYEGQYMLVTKFEYWLRSPARGDVVVFDPPSDPGGIPLIKRVIGLPGEHIEVRGGDVYIDGTRLNEPYLQSKTMSHYDGVVPANALFVMGDNRGNSSDSRSWGPLPIPNIVGRAALSYWPPSRWSILPSYAYNAPAQ